MKKLKITSTLLALIAVLVSCGKMDDNYAQYLEKEKVYSPKITNLVAKSALKEVTLLWDNPVGDIARQIFIDYQDSTITTEGMIDSIRITNLEIKGYVFSVYTIDAYGNLSIPEPVNVFPNGE